MDRRGAATGPAPVDGGQVATLQLAPSTGTPTHRWRWGWPVLAGAAALANLTFVARPLVGSALSPVSTEISALSVAGQPLAWMFRTGDAAFGVATALLAVGVAAHPAAWRPPSSRRPDRVPEHGRGWDAARLLTAGLALSGVGNVLAAAVPETSTWDAHRSDLLGSPADVVHGAASLLAGSGLVLGAVACATGLLRSGRDGRPRTVALAVGLGVVLVGSSVAEAVGAVLGDVRGSGAVQRAQVLGSSVWTVLVGVLVGRVRERPPE